MMYSLGLNGTWISAGTLGGAIRGDLRILPLQGNILYATRRLPVGAAQLLDSNMAHKLGDKEDVYKLVREAYGIDDDAQYE
eukprot:2977045-Amphidinium_carterae.1